MERARRKRIVAYLLVAAGVLSPLVGACGGGSDSDQSANSGNSGRSGQNSVEPGRRESAPLGSVELPPLEFATIDDSGTVSADVTSEALFDFDSAELKPAVAEIVDQIATRLVANPSWVRIDGFTDGQGSEEHNLELSQRRADALATEISALGTAEDVQSCGRGEQGTDGESEDPSARRVVVTISPSPFSEVCG